MKHTILLTFDYELFLGQSGSVDNCLIKPTNLLLDILNSNNAHATFFIDATYLLKLIEVGDTYQYNIIKEQIQYLIKCGHEIGLHIHPHWVDAEYINERGEWLFKDYSKYKICNCPKDILDRLFDDGTNLLNTIAREIAPEYHIKSFRAGGWCVDPFSNIIDSLVRNNIFIDSSVIPYRKLKDNSISSYDYSDIKVSFPYRFGSNPHLKENMGRFLEIPISTYYSFPKSFFKTLFLRRLSSSSSNAKRFGDGKSVFDIEKQSNAGRFLKYLIGKRSYYSCDSSTSGLLDCLKKDKRELITIVSHPKCLSLDSLDIIRDIVSSGDNFCTTIADYSEGYKYGV